jgi:hypothetical protein
MAGNPNGRLKVAFVSDYLQATKDDKDFLAIRSGGFSTKIVQDALLFTPDFAQRESADLEGVKELLRSSVGATTFNLSREVTEWWKPYEEIGHWIETFNGNKPLLSNNITLDQIIKRINNYNIHYPEKPARVALVLTLRPHQDPFLCTMDFGKNYILKAMEWGASDPSDTATPRFVRQPRPSGL